MENLAVGCPGMPATSQEFLILLQGTEAQSGLAMEAYVIRQVCFLPHVSQSRQAASGPERSRPMSDFPSKRPKADGSTRGDQTM